MFDFFLALNQFNFFVGLTKELHICHVFAIMSDSHIHGERVYTEAMLHRRCGYMLVDDFDYDIAVEFLRRKGFSEEEVKLTWEYFGGKPVYLVEAVKERDRLSSTRRCLRTERTSFSTELNPEKKMFNIVVELLKQFVDSGRCIQVSELTDLFYFFNIIIF